MQGIHYFTSESVSEGHPDKVADQIADAILDTYLKKDKHAHVACECGVTKGTVFLFGEITSKAHVNVRKVARNVIKRIGYTKGIYGFDYHSCAILNDINIQSPDIDEGINKKTTDKLNSVGAGDQGIMYGYACDDTKSLMPLSITLAHRLTHYTAYVRKHHIIPYLRPDAKSEVTIKYDGNTPLEVSSVVLSTQHDDVPLSKLRKDVKNKIIDKVIPNNLLSKDTKYLVNPAGKFIIGGPAGDSGLTGRKIIVDTYGGVARHGGGAFSGKDPTKVDRSGAYMARYVAKNIVASGIAKRCEVQLAYAIGKVQPVSVQVNTFNTSKYSNQLIDKIIKKIFDFRPMAIIQNLNLLNIDYEKTTCYGAFGRPDLNLPWERMDKVKQIKQLLKYQDMK